MINKEKVNRNFSRQAKQYDRFANVQKKMAENLMAQLPSQKNVINILEVGCGTGYLTERLLERYSEVRITAIDLAEGMIEFMRDRFAGEGRLLLLCEDAERFSPAYSEKYDLIVSNAAFQWLTNPAKTLERFANYLSAEGEMHFTTFGRRTFQELHKSHVIAAEQLGKCVEQTRPGPQFATLSEWRMHCVQAGLNTRFKTEDMVEFFPASRDFLHSVKKIGAGNAEGMSGAGLLRRLLQIYDEEYFTHRGVPATYEVFQATCHKSGKAGALTLSNNIDNMNDVQSVRV
ncbi:malonyl-ACP O-methyltransferase BioC [Aciduricibacillus chroicocephali]|uniref:Malonyl-[acyl-carrier protein] O-methyltransferase n=1 Tax=Aciduricibacillus chroicocephali TaxID=3054939 RepID=A0ABY9KUD2_9BACI|nr:malonyl-ACP O-methyltransferase BioC [Bacillaceae bacterium 44XB]